MVVLVPLLAAAAVVSVNALPEKAAACCCSRAKDLIPRSPLKATQATSGCVDSYPDWFMLTATDAHNSKRGLQKRECHEEGTLMTSLQNGVLTDAYGRTGCVVANYQFQFDGPPQAGTIYSSGWSVCDGKLNLHGSQNVFWKCPSGRDNGEIFYNLYDRQWTGHCEPIYMEMMPCSGSTAPPRGSPPPVSVIPDGQPQVGKGPVGQIGDGQIQAPKPGAKPIGVIPDGQPQTPGSGSSTPDKKPIGVIPDGQPQAPGSSSGTPGKKPIGVISDGQPQAPSGSSSTSGTSGNKPIGVISDGQPQAPSANGSSSGTSGNKPIGVIPDGQPQAPSGSSNTSATSGNKPIAVIPDGQPQAPAGKGPAPKPANKPLDVIPDGQPQAGRKAVSNQFVASAKNIGAATQVPVIIGGVLAAVAVVFG